MNSLTTIKAWIRRASCISATLTLVNLANPAAAATLQEQLERAVQEFSQGQYAAAYWQFESMELDYGLEPEFLDHAFQGKILPVRGYAALVADRPTDALVFFAELLRAHNPRPGVRAFALYNAAIAQSQVGALAAAAQTFKAFQHTFPHSNESALALLHEADLRAEIGDDAEAEALLDAFYQSEAPKTLRMQARLRALQLAGRTNNTKRAQHILFETDWAVDSMPEIAVLSFAALNAGDLLLTEGQYAAAIRAYRLTLPLEHLIQKQKELLQATESTLAQQSPYTSSIWKSHSQQLVARLRSQVARLESIEDYTPGLYLRIGQTYLLNQRYYEAAILFRTVASTPEFQKNLRAEAHYRWVLTLTEAKKWDAARATASAFLAEHPTHSLANSTLFLIARSYQSEGDSPKAISVLDQLIQNFPADKQAPMWYFSRGYNYCALELQALARESFDSALSQFPQSSLRQKIQLWHALSYFFDRAYDTSLSELQALSKDNATHPLYPEINYRIANVFYAQRDYTAALKIIDTLTQDFPEHSRFGEAQALRGDIYMGLGELTQAAHAFSQVPADQPRIYDYGVFQAAKIYKALERYDLLRTHLHRYVDRPDAADRPRVSEALYWIAWSLQQQGRAQEAFPIFEAALDRFGNNPRAHAVSSILSAYAGLHKRNSAHDDNSELSFGTWLQNTSDQALKLGQLTRFTRIKAFTAARQRRSINDATADATLLSIHRFVPLQAQDPETLAQIGIVLAEREYDSADDYFEHLLTEYPKRFERAAAYYGKAKLAAKDNKFPEAQRWLLRFMEETPTHPLAAPARLLAAEVLTTQGLYAAARTTLNEILQLKEMRGRPHAEALAGLARIETEEGNLKRAIPYWQRIYTLYRAHPDLIATAYWQSALLFESIGDPIAARNTIEEMLRDNRMQEFPTYAAAEAKLPQIRSAAEAQSQLVNTPIQEVGP
jgi:tetratricopeptide (TPR) repeat protein